LRPASIPRGAVDLAVSTAVEVCGAEAGRALPVDPDKMTAIHVGDAQGVFGEVLTPAERRVFRAGPEGGRELLDRMEGERRVPAGQRRPPPRPSADSTPCRSAAVQDLPRQRLGVPRVVSMACRERDFSDSERDLIAYLAAQAAVSIENSSIHKRARRQAVTDELTGLRTRTVSTRPSPASSSESVASAAR
jgi:hypothetical protein